MRKPWLTTGIGLLAIGLLLLAAPGPAAAEPPTAIRKSFTSFCQQWMQKLVARERDNLKKASSNGGRGSLEYTGYSSKPLRCEARASRFPSNPFVGKLVYNELLYRQNGSKNQPAVVQQIEVMEIFRFDGSRWQY